MKLSEIIVKKGYMKRETIKGTTGGYESSENQAEATLTFQVDEDEDPKVALENADKEVRAAAKQLLDEDPAWMGKPGIADSQPKEKNE
jgi:DNA-directed RNA polymerase subunit L